VFVQLTVAGRGDGGVVEWIRTTDGGCPGRRGCGFVQLTVAGRDGGAADQGSHN
jgi:hypothetical protein